MITGNEPAMPIQIPVFDKDGNMVTANHTGLTIHQHFAAMAMQGLLSNSTGDIQKVITENDAKLYAEDAVRITDALIAELNK